jgi:type II secretory pathway pseudopilin PulG
MRSGVALVDAIAAVIILGISLTVILGLTGQAITSQRVGEELQNAAMLADEQLNLVLARGPDDYGKTFPVDGACDEPFQTYRFKLDITGQGGAAPYQVKVTISWPSPGAIGGERTVAVETLISGRSLPTNQIDRQPQQPVERLQ